MTRDYHELKFFRQTLKWLSPRLLSNINLISFDFCYTRSKFLHHKLADHKTITLFLFFIYISIFHLYRKLFTSRLSMALRSYLQGFYLKGTNIFSSSSYLQGFDLKGANIFSSSLGRWHEEKHPISKLCSMKPQKFIEENSNLNQPR